MSTKMFFQALAMALLCAGVASAAEQPIQDGAQMFSPATVSQLDQEIGAFTAQTGKQIVVVTVPSLNGKPLADAAQAVFQQQNINGMLIFIAKDDRKDYFLPDTATAQFFPESTLASIRQSMESLFKAEDYDGGITAAVNGVLSIFRAHLNSAPANGATNNYPVPSNAHQYVRRSSGGISHVFIWIVLIVIGYLILRSIFRAMSGPRYYGGPGVPPGAGGPGPGYGGPGYGGYGGPGYYGGGGGFWSGLLGGLGGAWLGNEMFGNRGTTIVEQPGGNVMPTDQGGSWGGGDAGGWANDAGQADTGAGSGGDWGGGGFGGGGDFGGGGFGGGGDGGGGGGW